MAGYFALPPSMTDTPNWATYPSAGNGEKRTSTAHTPDVLPTSAPSMRPWRPGPLQATNWIPMVITFALIAVGLEVALRFSKKSAGWPIAEKTNIREFEALQYAFHLPPVVFSMLVVAAWSQVDNELKKIQPFLNLAKGNSPAKYSVLLNYTRNNKFRLWLDAGRNGHYTIAIASLLSMLVLIFNPLASSIFVIGDIEVPSPVKQVGNSATLGLNKASPRFQDFTLFLAAAGFAGASVQYPLPDPAFVKGQWSVAPFAMPSGLNRNGSVTARTTAVKSMPNCTKFPSLNTTPLPAVNGYDNTATFSNCKSNWTVDHNTASEFEAFVAECNDDPSTPPDFRRVAFWFFTSQPRPLVTAILCSPQIELWDVTATMDLATSNVTSLVPLNRNTNANSITQSPSNGRAHNGIELSGISTDFFTQQRQTATKLQLPAAVLQAASVSGVYNADRFAELTNKVYGTYLATLAEGIYFVPTTDSMGAEVKTLERRVWLSEVATHITVACLLVLAITSSLLLLKGQAERERLPVAHEPGTIGAAVYLGAGTSLGRALQKPTADLSKALEGRTFKLDAVRMKIYEQDDVENEEVLLSEEV